VYGWRFLATEVDAESVVATRSVLEANELTQQVEVRQVTNSKLLLHSVLRAHGDTDEDGTVQAGDGAFDFLVCNPPFFSSLDSTGQNSARAANATPSELVCPGGEEAFVAQLIREHRALRDDKSSGLSLRWCSTMLGRKSSLKSLTALLHSRVVAAAVVQTTEFKQGQQSRWGLAWSFETSEREKIEQRLQNQQQQKQQQTAKSTSLPSSNAATASMFAAAASRTAAAPTVVLPLRSRARIDVRRTQLSGAQVRERVLSLTAAYAQQQNLELRLQPALPTSYEWTVRMQQHDSVPITAAPTPASACCLSLAVRLLHAPPSDWSIELEWKKPPNAADRTPQQTAFTYFAAHMQRECTAANMRA